LKLASDTSFEVKPPIETPVIKVFGTAMENDSTALKPSIQFDENQNLNIGLKDRVDIRFVAANLAPKPKLLTDNVVTVYHRQQYCHACQCRLQTKSRVNRKRNERTVALPD